ncbi:hypothetical protein SI65_08445 [Aspergillus cristatus]|uniref:Uncharacterized protein n=1 Tax=Aspergillus cristatus TaxID=573508 RepID=A0A1E3B5D7_ASPCR|nr:hypothetical protein SI65_08445 [Aspergillus cristatus]
MPYDQLPTPNPEIENTKYNQRLSDLHKDMTQANKIFYQASGQLSETNEELHDLDRRLDALEDKFKERGKEMELLKQALAEYEEQMLRAKDALIEKEMDDATRVAGDDADVDAWVLARTGSDL